MISDTTASPKQDDEDDHTKLGLGQVLRYFTLRSLGGTLIKVVWYHGVRNG